MSLARNRASLYNRSRTPPWPLPFSSSSRRRFIGRLVVLVPVLALSLFARFALAAAPVSTLLVVGDSISAAYGLAPGTGWVDLLAARLAEKELPYRVVNASITGDTTAGGRARLPALLATHKPSIVVIELGGNDGLRGGNLASTRDNLSAAVAAVQRANAKAAADRDEAAAQLWRRVCPRVRCAVRRCRARKQDAARAASLFEGFGETQRSASSPTASIRLAAAQPLLLDNVWPVLLLPSGLRPMIELRRASHDNTVTVARLGDFRERIDVRSPSEYRRGSRARGLQSSGARRHGARTHRDDACGRLGRSRRGAPEPPSSRATSRQ